jgi:hypothetical protein
MRDNLPYKIRKNESSIINLDDAVNEGSHWVCFKKINNNAIYFDSFGNLRPPLELIDYLNSSGPCKIAYNHEKFQNYNTVNCGHLCLNFLSHRS